MNFEDKVSSYSAEQHDMLHAERVLDNIHRMHPYMITGVVERGQGGGSCAHAGANRAHSFGVGRTKGVFQVDT